MRKLCLPFLFVVALVLLLFCFFFFFSFVSEGHILSNSSTLKWEDQQSSPSKFSFLFYACLFLCFALGFPVSLYCLWTHWSVCCVCLPLGSDHLFCLLLVRTDNQICTVYSMSSVFISCCFHSKTQTSSALHCISTFSTVFLLCLHYAFDVILFYFGLQYIVQIMNSAVELYSKESQH